MTVISLQKAKDTCAQLKTAVISSNPDIIKASNALEELKVKNCCFFFFLSSFSSVSSQISLDFYSHTSYTQELLLDFDSLPPLGIDSTLANEERQLACEVFEYGVLASVNSGQ